MSAVPAVSLFVCVHHARALLWLLTTCTSSIIHSFTSSESGRLIAAQPERWRGGGDQREDHTDTHTYILCVCVGGGGGGVLALLCILQRARCPDV